MSSKIRLAKNREEKSSLLNKKRWLILPLLLLSISADAKTLYVDGATGDDSVTWAQNGPSNPWRTLTRATWGSTNPNARVAAQAAQAGDTVIIAAGTYSAPGTNTRDTPAFFQKIPEHRAIRSSFRRVERSFWP
jgi:hypothetical protein